MAEKPRTVAVRSYGTVVDAVERRIFRVDRWRLPTPHGVSVRAIGYSASALAAILIAGGLPVVGVAIEALPASVRYLVLPALIGWALVSTRLDGRAPHRALVAAAGWRLAPRTLAGLRRAPGVGSWLSPVWAVQIAPSGDEPRYRVGRVRGPARLTLRYPAELHREGVGLRRRLRTRRVRVRSLRGRALANGHELELSERAEVVFE